MTTAIVLREAGGPENLKLEPVNIPRPAPDEIRLRHTAVGVNFHDVYVRSGLYQTLALPGIPGIEGVGVVTELGGHVRELAVGDRVAYIHRGYGAYSEERILPAVAAIPVPSSIPDDILAASLLKGLTAYVLLHSVYTVKPGDCLLIHAATGGVGALLTQWAHHLGARVIGTVGSEEKVALARQYGCDHVIQYRQEDFVARVKDITHGLGVHAAYDAVGKDTFSGSLDVLAPCGHLVNFGQASGPVPPFEVSALFAKSATLSRPSVFQYLRAPEQLRMAAKAFLKALQTQVVRPGHISPFSLERAAQAHIQMESRSRQGAVILTIP